MNSFSQQAPAVDDALRASQERFRLIFDSLPTPCVIYDAQRRFRYINRTMAQLLRRTEEEAIGYRDEDLLPAQFTQIYLPLLCQAIETRLPQRAECSFSGPLGTAHYIAHYVPMLDEHGQVREVLGISYDISPQKRVEQELRQRDDEMRSLADNVPDIIARVDRAGRYLYVNRRVEEITGLPREEFLGKNSRELNFPDELLDVWDRDRHRAFDTAQTVESDFVWQGSTEPRYFESRHIPEVSDDGTVRTLLTLIRDISDQKLAQLKLTESEERFRMAFESIPVGMVVLDSKLRVQRANRALREMLGYSEAELMTISPYDITHPDDLAEGRDKMAALTRGDIPYYTREKRHLTKDGRVIWGRLTTALVRGQDGDPQRYIGILEDIAERRAAEEELARYRENLEELVRSRTRALEASQQTLRSAERLASLGTLAAGIAHEINNPVGTILLAAEMAMAAHDAQDSESVVRCLAGIKADAQRCGRIVKNVLHFARQEPTEKSLHPLNEVVNDAVRRTQAYAAERGAQVITALGKSVGTVLMNPIALEQALTNVLRNSIESHQRPITIRVATLACHKHYEVTIADDGPGIAREALLHIFDPFFTMRRTNGGVGLGLSLVHGTINDHQGRIRVDSAVGRGTTFTIELPCPPVQA
ncbi:MAG TPA: PAS domain S-box protein [Pirellulales bacterium]|nr:PAS domain S-box protein [Pirellulales bacterium]